MYETFNINENSVVSVIVPVYNVAEYLPKCIESIQMQTYFELQIILVDDGSTDGSGKICDKYAENDKRIQVIHKENGGLVSARKAGLSAVSGAYVGFVDGDDYIEESFYQHMIYSLKNSDADFVHSGIIVEEANGNTEVFATTCGKKITDEDNKIELIQRHILCHYESDGEHLVSILCSKLFHTDFIKECYGCVPDNQSFGEDMLAFCRGILKSHQFIVLANAEYHYMIRENSLSHTWDMNHFWRESNLHKELCLIWKEYDCLDKMESFMESYLLIRMIDCMNRIYGKGLGTVSYILPDNGILKKHRLVIYGAGKVGKDYISQMILEPEYNIVAWTDKKFHMKFNNLCLPVECLKKIDFDVVVIAVKNETIASEIKKQLLALNIADEKLMWLAPLEKE